MYKIRTNALPRPMHSAAAASSDAEQRQQEKRQNVVQRHDRSGERLIQMERFGQDLGDDAVVHLPESTDRQKRQAHQNRATVVQLHGNAPS